MPIVRNKTEKIKMALYLEAAMKRFEMVIFKATSQFDLASLPDHKNMLLSDFLKERCILQQVLASLCAKVLLLLCRPLCLLSE